MVVAKIFIQRKLKNYQNQLKLLFWIIYFCFIYYLQNISNWSKLLKRKETSYFSLKGKRYYFPNRTIRKGKRHQNLEIFVEDMKEKLSNLKRVKRWWYDGASEKESKKKDKELIEWNI